MELPDEIVYKICNMLTKVRQIPRELKDEIVSYKLYRMFSEVVAITGSRNLSWGILYGMFSGMTTVVLSGPFEDRTCEKWLNLTNAQRDVYSLNPWKNIKSVFRDDDGTWTVEYTRRRSFKTYGC